VTNSSQPTEFVPHPEAVIWRDGDLIRFADATVHVLSHAANRGSVVFDVLRLTSTETDLATIGLRPHIARFERSMETMGMVSRFGVGDLEAAVLETAAANAHAQTLKGGTVKIMAAWKEIPLGSVPASLEPSIHISVLPGDPPSGFDNPVRVTRSTMPKIPETILPPTLKVAAGYGPGVRQQMLARAQGFDDAIFASVTNGLAEANTDSLLVVKGEQIVAPPFDTVLDGITRRLLFELARYNGLVHDVRDVSWVEVMDADELIMTSTVDFVKPVASIDEVEFTAPGPVAKLLGAEVAALARNKHELAKKWLTIVP